MPKPTKPPQFDSCAITYPTDRITFGQMRQREPSLFRNPACVKEFDITAVHYWEYVLARKAFARSAGQPDPSPNIKKTELVSILNDAYKPYGLSAGIHETKQLVRDVEHAVITQAKAKLGRTR